MAGKTIFNRKRIMRLSVTVMALALCMAAHATESDSVRVQHRLEISGRGAYVLPVGMLDGNNAFSAKTRSAFSGGAEYSFVFPYSTRYGRWYPQAYQGAGVSVTAFDSDRITGTPVNIYVLQGAPLAHIGGRLSVEYEWNFGISAGWNKMSPDVQLSPDEIDGFGSRVNAYIDLGIKIGYALSERLALTAGVNLSHFSNGNTDLPNPGVNVLWGKVGLLYRMGTVVRPRKADWSDFVRHMSYDITAYGAWRKWGFDSNYGLEGAERSMVLIPGHFGVAGLSVNPLYHFNPCLSVGGALDFQYDEGANLAACHVPGSAVDDPKFYRQPFGHRVMLGLSARAELRMPVFAVNIGIGHSVAAPGGADLRGWYQIFTLKTFVTRALYLSTGYRLVDFHKPGNLMLGAGWSFNAL